MCKFTNISCDSWTGQILYSDIHVDLVDDDNIPTGYAKERHFLNNMTYIPVIGSLAGVARIALAVVHILLHFLAAVFTCNWDHLAHVVKGSAELLRGIIETIPVVGTIFACWHDGLLKSQHWCFFLVKIELTPDL